MSTWLQPLQTALRAIPKDVEVKAIRKVINQELYSRQPVKPLCPHNQLIELWCKAFESRFGAKYVFLGKDAQAVKRLLAIDYGADPVTHVMKIARAAWEHKDKYPCNMSLTLPKLLSHINEIREWLNANHDGKPTIPLFKQLEILKDMRQNHPCNPDSIAYDEKPTTAQRQEFADIKRKISELEQAQRRQVMA